ncbi:hypothetical protein B0H67DRAFT_570601 [Lasiosphaeris hirsuta]|uniref:Uncharacterized protein n=1 Tax=Lasiosphaeris hirsuta TaxID=260670 RepID=A0AA40B0M5_9PEZI|nr:hypothetical protein B0H67DRAFT_570601 [Lasiosphaeris hirsuta]
MLFPSRDIPPQALTKINAMHSPVSLEPWTVPSHGQPGRDQEGDATTTWAGSTCSLARRMSAPARPALSLLFLRRRPTDGHGARAGSRLASNTMQSLNLKHARSMRCRCQPPLPLISLRLDCERHRIAPSRSRSKTSGLRASFAASQNADRNPRDPSASLQTRRATDKVQLGALQ